MSATNSYQEWVVLGERCHVAVLDVERVGEPGRLDGELRAAYSELGGRWSRRFPSKDEVPRWFADIASPWSIYTALPTSELVDLRAAFREYLDVCVARFYAPRARAALAGPEHPDVLAYKRHHELHSPGRKMLAPKFGRDWTDTFLQYHFGPTPEMAIRPAS